MISTRLSRALIALASLAFAAIAFMIWSVPDSAARWLDLTPIDAGGLAAIRAEVGGLFAGLAVLCGVAAHTNAPGWIGAAAAIVAGVVTGRAIGWVTAGVAGDAPAMLIELGLLAALAVLARSTTVVPGARRRSGPNAAIGAGVVALMIAGGAVVLANTAVQQRLFEAAAGRMAATVNDDPLVDDALRVAVCGSSAPLPSASRAKPCVAVFANGKFYVVDVGPESVENLVLWGVPLSSIGGVLLTHFHSDHIGDLGELNLQTWAGGRPVPLTVYGGPGVARVVAGFNDAYRLDQGYRTAHHSAAVMPPETWPMVARVIHLDGPETLAKDRQAVVLDEDGLRITAIEVNHAPIAPAYAYRFDYKGRSAVISGDMTFHPPLAAAARGTDLLVSEAIAVSMTRALGGGAASAGRSRTAKIMHDIEDYHVTPEQAARVANEAGATLLVFYHLLPSPDGPLARQIFARGVDQVREGRWTIADDGSLYTLPLHSSDVHIGRVTR